MEHVEFIHKDHFEYQYHRHWAMGKLARYIDFCWETDFASLLKEFPNGFTDVLFPNIGYTYLINLGSPFVMQLQKTSFEVKSGGFLPRHHFIACHHAAGNKVFGIKFKVCPIVFEKDVDFSEYKENIYPLSYLIDNNIVERIKTAATFKQRVNIVFDHYENLLSKYEGSLNYINIVTAILQECSKKQVFNISIEKVAAQHHVSMRTLQRYFRATTGYSSKQALQTIRIRQAVADLTSSPFTFSYANHGYYDYSHFHKHLEQFVGEKYVKQFSPRYIKSNMAR